MKKFCLKASILLIVIFLVTDCLGVEAQVCRPSGKIRGKKPLLANATKRMTLIAVFRVSFTGLTHLHHPSLVRPRHTSLLIALRRVEMVEAHQNICDNQYYSDNTPIVALSTGWFNKKGRCLNNITISANGRSVVAVVVDECDSTMGCDEDHDYQPPCDNDIVDASKAVWEASGVPNDNWGWMDVTWSDA